MRLRKVLRLRQMAHFDLQHHVVEHAAPCEEHGTLEYDADIVGGAAHRLAVESNLAGGSRQQAGRHFEQGRFAAARRTDNRHELALLDIEAERLQRFNGTVVGLIDLGDAVDFDQWPLHNRPDRRSFPVALEGHGWRSWHRNALCSNYGRYAFV